jgi:cytochrome c-type biogenesis protein
MGTLLLPLVAMLAGIVSFSSPCCLPLLPGYVSYISALPVADLSPRDARRVTVRAAMLFVAGFTLIFSLLGAASGLLGAWLITNLDTIVRVAGVGIIALGLTSMGLFRIPWLLRERRFDLARLPRGPSGAFPLGMAFAAGWTPCIGPILATILTTAAVAGTATWGAFLLVCYSIGLGLPFIALAVGFDRLRGSLGFLQRNGRRIEIVGGMLMVAVGVLFVSGDWQQLFRPLQREFAQLGWPPI